MSKHTPGPWVWERRFLISRQEYKPGYVAEIGVLQCEPDEMPSEDDARVIAAAPDLLDALKKLFSSAPASGFTRERDNIAYGEALALASAAIAKAEGGGK